MPGLTRAQWLRRLRMDRLNLLAQTADEQNGRVRLDAHWAERLDPAYAASLREAILNQQPPELEDAQ